MTVGAAPPLATATSGAQLSQLTPEKLPKPKASVRGQQIALVTGGNRGIGLEVVKSLLEDDACHHVYLGCRDLQMGQALAQKLCQKYGGQRVVEAIELDVTSAGSITEAVEKVRASGLQLTILVNNAGILLDGDDAPFDLAAVHTTMQVNFDGAVAVTEAFLPLLMNAPGGGQVLSTSSGNGPRAMGLLSEKDRQALMDPSLDVVQLRAIMGQLVDGLQDPKNVYHDIPQVGYGFSKMALNCFTQILARKHPAMQINACSPGFCNTDMCANYTGAKKPKEPALGASVFKKALFGDLGRGQTGCFFKESSKTDTPLDKAVSVVDPWVQ